MIKPYINIKETDEYIIRSFDKSIDPTELKWHRDQEDRLVTVLECGPGWKFQHDNELPIDLHPNTTILIPKYTYHRAIKGKGNLLLKIHKLVIL